jgi:mannan endo-1,4-beta-mannosidase
MLKNVKLARVMGVGFALATALFVSGCSETVTPELKTTPAQEEGVFGNGCNLQPAYYNSGNPNLGLSLMKSQSKIKTVRLEIDPYAYAFTIAKAKSWIDQLKAQGYTLICTFHNFGGSDKASDLMTAANWWKANYSTLGGGFTINLCNEWGSHNVTSNAYASAYNSAISTVRSVYSGNIIVDIPGWGQETKTAMDAIKGTNGTKINDTKIILSAHIYPGAYNQGRGRAMIASDLDDMTNSGRPCMIGEFGSIGGSGADWSGIVNYAKGKGWTVLGWAWNGDGLGMNMVTPAWSSNASATSFSLSPYFNTVYNKL